MSRSHWSRVFLCFCLHRAFVSVLVVPHTKGQRWVDQGIEEFNRRSEQRELVLLQRKAHKHGMQLVPTA
jgi:hypothetical protein